MELNVKKCKYMCFIRSSPTNGCYTMNGAVLELVNSFNHLGIIFDRNLDFRIHITSSVRKATYILGIIKRWAKEFYDPYVTKQLFTALVWPILEYGSIIWDSQNDVHSDKIESIQKQFLLFCLRHLQNRCDPNIRLPSYEKHLAFIKIRSLKNH